MTIAEYIAHKIQACGVDRFFGIPGDFALPLYAVLDGAGLAPVVCTHEPNCVFAADAYARLRGLGVVCTTYGVGGLNMVNPVAMAYAERSPVVVISGAPEAKGRQLRPFVHHLVKDYDTQLNVFAEVTCFAADLRNPATARADIDRAFAMAAAEKRPVYLELPRDMTHAELPEQDLAPEACPSGPSLDLRALDEASADILGLFEQARKPVIWAGVGVRRAAVVEEVMAWAERWNLPVLASCMGKAAFPESHPNYAGVYMGDMSDPEAKAVMDAADLVLSVGVIFSDVNTGFFTADFEDKILVDMRDVEVRVSRRRYEQVPMAELVDRLAQSATTARGTLPQARPRSRPAAPAQDGRLSMSELIDGLAGLDQKRYSFLADVGDCWFIGLELRTDIFMAPGYYASMGFAVPGALGAAMAEPRLRPVVIVGDGAFQMTGAEMATLARYGFAPIVVVVNNASYKMLGTFDQPRTYYELPTWDYAGYARSLGCEGQRATTAVELADALDAAIQSESPFLVEAVIERLDDHPPIMQRIREFFGK